MCLLIPGVYSSNDSHYHKTFYCGAVWQDIIIYQTKNNILTIIIQYNSTVSRHTVVCRAAQEAGVPHREYIYRKKVNAIFTPL